jgi:hypothetical protein
MLTSRYRMIAAVATVLISTGFAGVGVSEAKGPSQRDTLALDVFAGWSRPTPSQMGARARISTDALAALSRLKHAQAAPSLTDQAVLAPYRDIAGAISRATVRLTVTTGQTSQPGPMPSRKGASAQVALTAASTICGWVEATENRYAGWPDYSWEYSWHNHLDTCWNGSTVTHLNSAYAYVNHIQTGWNYRGEVSSSVGSAGAWQLQDFKQSRMEFCVLKYGCIQSLYPSAQIIQYGNGTNAISRRSTG